MMRSSSTLTGWNRSFVETGVFDGGEQAVGAFAVGSMPDADGTVTRLLAEVEALCARFRMEGADVLP